MLKWSPTIALKVGLVRTIDYFEHLLRSNRVIEAEEPLSFVAQA
jgi:hypothetical protein